MKKTIFVAAILLTLMISIVSATEMCEDRITPNTECRLVSPVISCAVYNYTITDTAGEIIKNEAMAQLNNSLYYATFNQPVGDYLITLCDNTTRELYVQQSEVETNMSSVAISVILIGFIFWLIYIARSISTKDEKNSPIIFNTAIQYSLFSVAAVVSFFLVQIAYGFSIDGGLGTGIQETLKTQYIFVNTVGVILFAILGLALIVASYQVIVLYLKQYFSSKGGRND